MILSRHGFLSSDLSSVSPVEEEGHAKEEGPAKENAKKLAFAVDNIYIARIVA